MKSVIKNIIFFALCFTTSWQLQAQCTLSATSSGSTSGNTQVYVLVDASNDIVAQNTTGTFTSVAVGSYQIHALNYDPSNAPSPLPSALIGQPVSNVGSTTTGCYNSDFLTDFVSETCVNPSCSQTNSICENSPIIASSSGSTSGNIQVYVLADDSGNFIAQNTIGNFPTTSFAAGETYQVHALNYDGSNPPTTLPSGLSVGDPLSNITGGCINTDFLTDYICFNIISCTCTPTDICEGDDISASTTGSTPGNIQVYVLADDSGNFVAQNSTGTFPTSTYTVGDTYQVHALNYDGSNPPSPLPSGLSLGDPLSNITGGCFNADFLSDYVCFNIIDCTCTPTAICSDVTFTVEKTGFNASYELVYVLVDALGDIIDQNDTGIFDASTLTIGDIYNIHALNYDSSNAPDPLPSGLIGQPVANVGNITPGCYNANFLTDIVCYEIECCTSQLGFTR